MRHYLRRFSVNGSLAVLGIAIGAANIVALISVTDTARHQTLRMLDDYGANTLFVSPYYDEDNPSMMRANAFAFVPERYLEHIRGMPELSAAAGALMRFGHVGYGRERLFATIEGASPEYPGIRGHGIASGRFHTAADESERARVCCLGYGMVEPLFGDADPLGEQLVIKGERFTVIGTMIEKGRIGFEDFDKRVFIPLATAQELFEIDGVNAIMAAVDPERDMETVQHAVEARIRAAEGLSPDDPPDFSVSSIEQLTGVIDTSLDVFRLLMAGIASVALLVAGTGIMNVMLMQVIARTREIGIRRAVGARRRDVFLHFLEEAVAQTIVGAFLGTIVGIVISWLFCLFVDWQLYLSPLTIVVAVLFCGLVGIAFGVYPAFHASRLKPIDCLRYE